MNINKSNVFFIISILIHEILRSEWQVLINRLVKKKKAVYAKHKQPFKLKIK